MKTAARDCKVKLFASEEQFPELVNPVQMALDTKGRLWVAAWQNYPERTPQSTTATACSIFEDTNGDGKADKCTPFVDDLNCPTGFPVLQGRRAPHAGAGRLVRPRHRRRRPGRLERARA